MRYDVRNIKTVEEIENFIIENKIDNSLDINEIYENEKMSLLFSKVLNNMSFQKNYYYSLTFDFGKGAVDVYYNIEWDDENNSYYLQVEYISNDEALEDIKNHQDYLKKIKKEYENLTLEENAKIWAEAIIMMRKERR